MLIQLLRFHSLVSLVVFLMLLGAFWTDATTPKSDRLSWLLIGVASLLWFVSIPLSIVETASKLFQSELPKSESVQ